jgi:hypothetical protein
LDYFRFVWSRAATLGSGTATAKKKKTTARRLLSGTLCLRTWKTLSCCFSLQTLQTCWWTKE